MPLAVPGLVMRAGMLLLLIRICPTDSTHPVRDCRDGAAPCLRSTVTEHTGVVTADRLEMISTDPQVMHGQAVIAQD
jgi:hypothetical protein